MPRRRHERRHLPTRHLLEFNLPSSNVNMSRGLVLFAPCRHAFDASERGELFGCRGLGPPRRASIDAPVRQQR